MSASLGMPQSILFDTQLTPHDRKPITELTLICHNAFKSNPSQVIISTGRFPKQLKQIADFQLEFMEGE
jgi:hypothetical protein